MGTLRRIALVYMVILLAAASLNYIPGLTDPEGRAFGVRTIKVALHLGRIDSRIKVCQIPFGQGAQRLAARHEGFRGLSCG